MMILEGGQSLDVTPEQIQALLAKDLIYKCGECRGDTYHITPEKTWADVDAALGLSNV